MSSISSVGGASSAWPDPGAGRAAAMKERMFAKVDTDGSASVDKAEMQTMLDRIGERTGQSLGNADELLTEMDSNGDGGLSSDELDAGMRSLLPPPSSTVQFAERRSQDGAAAADELFAAIDTDGDGSISKGELGVAVTASAGRPPPAEGAPPPGAAPAAASSASGTSSTTTDPLDTNEDGVVSAQERLAGELEALMTAMDSNGDKAVSADEVDSFVSELGALMREAYSRAASNHASTAAVDVAV
jgi:Ca2+-binding EF-hand superfamily protein